MTALAADGIYPQYVQVGNEIDSGMLWPIGSVGATTTNGNNFTQIAGLINSGYQRGEGGQQFHAGRHSPVDHQQSQRPLSGSLTG